MKQDYMDSRFAGHPHIFGLALAHTDDEKLIP
jgi:hypothetical protein